MASTQQDKPDSPISLRETIDLPNGIRGDIRARIKQMYKDWDFKRLNRPIPIDPYLLESITGYLYSDATSEGDTLENRIAHLGPYMKTYVFNETMGGYYGAEHPEGGIPFVYRLNYVDSDKDGELGVIYVTPVKWSASRRAFMWWVKYVTMVVWQDGTFRLLAYLIALFLVVAALSTLVLWIKELFWPSLF